MGTDGEFQIDQTFPSTPKRGPKNLSFSKLDSLSNVYRLQLTHANVLPLLFWYTNVFKCRIKVYVVIIYYCKENLGLLYPPQP